MVSIGPNLGKQIKDMSKLVHVDTQKTAVQTSQTSESKTPAKPAKPAALPQDIKPMADLVANYNIGAQLMPAVERTVGVDAKAPGGQRVTWRIHGHFDQKILDYLKDRIGPDDWVEFVDDSNPDNYWGSSGDFLD